MRGKHLAPRARPRRSWMSVGLILGLLLTMTIPAGASPDKVIRAAGNDATTMSADKVYSWGGVYDNTCVEYAMAAGYKGKVNMIQPAGNVDIVLGMSFGNLDPGTFTVFIDTNGSTPGPFTTIGTFVADEFGEGEFNYTLPAGSLADGTHNWAIWVNGPASCGVNYSILQTDTDLNFSIDAA